MINKITTKPSTKKYKEGWNRIFGGNVWKCPASGKRAAYVEERSSHIKTWCSVAGKCVKMVKL